MTHTRSAALLTAACLLGACGTATDATNATDATDALAESPASTAASGDAPSAGPIEIVVVMGDNAGPEYEKRVPLGAEVVLRVRNDDADDGFHLHGYDLGGNETAAGEEAVYRFTASQAGTFGLVSHVTGDLLLTLVVGD